MNGDKKTDAILLLKQPGEDSLDFETAAPRPLLVLIRQSDGKLKQVARNDKALLCRKCGGVFDDPYNGIEITTNGFTLSFYGGSNWRWGYDYKFLYKAPKKSWYLVKQTQHNYHTGNPDGTSKSVVIEETELGEIGIEKFDSAPAYPEDEWKVKAAKTFFNTCPKLGSQPRRSYLLKGNLAENIRELKNFVEVSFTDSKDNITTGFLLKKDLEKIQ
ncbi:MAG: hypothetical protein SGI83_18575 [Bacteroidota bacterium]|nr:hypothetical protein [Bacteroidota bacterium]